MSEWETFCDESYYHLWRVRRKSDRNFNDGFHVQDGKEAAALVELLNRLERERDEAREMQAKALRERESTEREVEAMLERAIKAEQERDEARLVARYLYKQLRKKLMEKVELDLHKSWEERSPWLFEEESK